MNHLSSEQITGLLVGDATEEEQRHVCECIACAAAATELRETFAIFHDVVHDWAYQTGGSVVPERAVPATKFGLLRMPRIAWSLALAVLILLVALPLYRNANLSHRTLGPEDALLLEEVNAHLSRTMPESMEPYIDMLPDTSLDEVGGRQ